jgi:hypothetical protein
MKLNHRNALFVFSFQQGEGDLFSDERFTDARRPLQDDIFLVVQEVRMLSNSVSLKKSFASASFLENFGGKRRWNRLIFNLRMKIEQVKNTF